MWCDVMCYNHSLVNSIRAKFQRRWINLTETARKRLNVSICGTVAYLLHNFKYNYYVSKLFNELFITQKSMLNDLCTWKAAPYRLSCQCYELSLCVYFWGVDEVIKYEIESNRIESLVECQKRRWKRRFFYSSIWWSSGKSRKKYGYAIVMHAKQTLFTFS